jgi:Aspartyl protease
MLGAVLGIVAFGAGAAERISLAVVLPKLGYEAVELRRTGENHWFLFGQVNGRRRSCLVDTGWSFTTVSTNTAKRLPDRIIGRLTLGRVELTNELVAVQDMRINGQAAPYDVVLGCDFLDRYQAVIDFANNRLYLRRAAPLAEQGEEFNRIMRSSGFVATELKRCDPPALTCGALMNGCAVELLVDSGAMWSCLDTKTARSMNLQFTPSPMRMMGAGASGRRNLAVADLKSMRLSGSEFPNVSVGVLSLADWGLGPDGKVLSGVGGILGGSELAAADAVLDCGRRKLWFRGRN